ncbi:hypothetical protein VU05_03045 [Desulfobulbus sp. F1]|nr:hypothetical protein [Desulfobulbus sp. F1]
MTKWNYAAFESNRPGREGITELEHKVREKLDELGLQAEHAKIAMTNMVEGAARAVVYYPETVISLPPAKKLAGWIKGDVNTKVDSIADAEQYKEEMYEGIAELLSSLSDEQAARSEIAATACKNGYATVTVWYPAEVL